MALNYVQPVTQLWALRGYRLRTSLCVKKYHTHGLSTESYSLFNYDAKRRNRANKPRNM